jgi:hypothetical protein
MATDFDRITPEQAALIKEASLFFVASAHPAFTAGPAGQGPVNLSPKGATPLHVLGENLVAYLDYAGSGNQTAAHLNQGGPITLMVMSHDASDAAIVRLFGTGRAVPIEESEHAATLLAAPATQLGLKLRQAIEVTVARTQTSCGYGVPVLEFRAQRARGQRGRRFKE